MRKLLFILLLIPCFVTAKELKFRSAKSKSTKDLEQTLVLLKPESVTCAHIGDIITVFRETA